MHPLVQPNAWVALKLPSGNLRVLQVTPNTWVLSRYLVKKVTFTDNDRPIALFL